MANNSQVGMQKNNINICCHFLRDLICDNILVVRFVHVEVNASGTMTKRVIVNLVTYHAGSVLEGHFVSQRDNVG